MVTLRFEHAGDYLSNPESLLNQLVRKVAPGDVQIIRNPRALVDVQVQATNYSAAYRLGRYAKQFVGEAPFGKGLTDARTKWANPPASSRAHASIWVTGENVRPPATPWQMTLSFDLDGFGGNNFYFPIWWNSLGLLGDASSPFMSRPPNLRSLLGSRMLESVPRRFCAVVMNNPHPMRLHALRILGRIDEVDCFGRAFGRPLPDKRTLEGQYKFILCFENDLYPGYVTEKAIEGWALGAIPLWWGSDPAGYLNPDAVINAAEFRSLAEFGEIVGDVNSSHDTWQAIASQPILTRQPSLGPIEQALKRIIEDVAR